MISFPIIAKLFFVNFSLDGSFLYLVFNGVMLHDDKSSMDCGQGVFLPSHCRLCFYHFLPFVEGFSSP